MDQSLCRVVISSDYLVVRGWTRAILPYPNNIHLGWPNVHHCVKFFVWVAGYDFLGILLFLIIEL